MRCSQSALVRIKRRVIKSGYLASDGVEQSIDDTLGEPALLVIVHLDHLAPVRSNLGKVQTLREINQVEDILLEAGSTKSDRGFEELGSDARVSTNSMGDFVNVCPGRFADCRKSIDGRDALGEHRVGGELGEFG